MGLVTHNKAEVPTKKNKYKVGNQDDLGADNVKETFELLSNTKIDREKFAYICKPGVCYAIFVDYTGHSISLHVYAPKVLTKKFIQEFLRYPFKQIQITNLLAPIRSDNPSVVNIVSKIGFQRYCTYRDYFGPGKDQIIYCAQYEDIKRWLE